MVARSCEDVLLLLYAPISALPFLLRVRMYASRWSLWTIQFRPNLVPNKAPRPI